MVKRRPSQQQKRRQSQSGAAASGKDGTGPQKKRARKGSAKQDETDYDSYVETIAHQLKNLPPVHSMEPKLGPCYHACQIFGMGAMPKSFGFEDLETKKGRLEGHYLNPHLPDQGEYYDVLPFGPDPPVPITHKVNSTVRAFYKQEFDQRPDRLDLLPMCSSPDLLYSSSPEPEPEMYEKEGAMKPWYDLEPDSDDDDDEEMTTPGTEIKQEEGEVLKDVKPDLPKLVERPRSPSIDVVQPIAIRPSPRQLITMRDVRDILDKESKQDDDQVTKAKSKSHLPLRTNGSLTSITMTLGGNGATKSVLKALNGIAKMLKIESPKNWIVEDRNGFKDVFRTKEEADREGEPMDMLDVLTSGTKICRQCEVVLLDKMVKKETEDLPFLTKTEKEDYKEVFFCNTECYFKFAISRTSPKSSVEVGNIEQLKKLQEKHREDQEKMKRLKVAGEAAVADSNGLDEVITHKGTTYKNWSVTLTQIKKHRKMNEQELTKMMFSMGLTKMPSMEVDDMRECLFCHTMGDRPADGPARLLNYDVNKWVHLNCALWSEEVYETVSGALVNVETALKSGVNSYCTVCEKNGATLKCWKVRCTNTYHVSCAVQDKAMFYKNKSIYCSQHIPKGEKDQELTTLSVFRRVFIDRDENRQVAKVMHQGTDQNLIRVGSLTFLSVGQLLPHQLHNFVTKDFIYPIGYKMMRFYWSTTEANKRCAYICSIVEVDNKPEFHVTANEGMENEIMFKSSTAREVWLQVLEAVDKLRREHDLTKVFTGHIIGEDLFGLLEPNVVKVLESLPGIESLNSYNFKYGANPMLELPLAVNPTGCARSEPKLRTHVKRVHNFQRTKAGDTGNAAATAAAAAASSNRQGSFGRAAKENAPVLIGLETTGPYSTKFVQSKSSQYRKMRQEWKQNVVLARSKIAGLGLYAARDLEKHQMIIEYIGEVIRSDLTDIREKRYESQNRGIYMFRLDDERVLDATMCGGMARYINHSCSPSCVTECVEVDRDLHIIIFANRRIARGEELCYDYKFDFEDDNRIPCMCGAENCRKWMN
jgi:histone-lysine N-methyltransferase MLL3